MLHPQLAVRGGHGPSVCVAIEHLSGARASEELGVRGEPWSQSSVDTEGQLRFLGSQRVTRGFLTLEVAVLGHALFKGHP